MADIDCAICLLPPIIFIIIHLCRFCYLPDRDSPPPDGPLPAAAVPSPPLPLPSAPPIPLPSRNSKQNESTIIIEQNIKAKTVDGDRALCAICLIEFKRKDVCCVLAGCNHKFHADCVKPWLLVNRTCPTCRRVVQ